MSDFACLPVDRLLVDHAGSKAFFDSLNIPVPPPGMSFLEYANIFDDDLLEDLGLDNRQLVQSFEDFMVNLKDETAKKGVYVQSITIIGGHDKEGVPEDVSLTLSQGEIVSIVGPTGSGKSRLLADIEWMARGDTPTGRSLLINGKPTDSAWRYSQQHRLIAQLSQNMGFIMDLTVREFIEMHARSRMEEEIASLSTRVVEMANAIAGEPLAESMRVTTLSGGQSRALMIADTALVSRSPVVLIDEIENAGIDREAALKLLTDKRKIVLVATHDPVLALVAERRVVMKNGGIRRILERTSQEKENLCSLQRIDAAMLRVRDAVRNGETIGKPFTELINGFSGSIGVGSDLSVNDL